MRQPPYHIITAAKAIMRVIVLAHEAVEGGAAGGFEGARGEHCQVVHVEPPPLWLSCDVEPLTTAHCSGVPVPPPLSTVVNPAASSIGFARLLRPPDRQNNIKGVLLSTGSASSGILFGSLLKSHSMAPAGTGMAIFSPAERRSTRTPLAASAARISDGVASMVLDARRVLVGLSY